MLLYFVSTCGIAISLVYILISLIFNLSSHSHQVATALLLTLTLWISGQTLFASMHQFVFKTTHTVWS